MVAVAKQFPDMRFVVYAAFERETTEGPYDPNRARTGTNALIKAMDDHGLPPNSNVQVTINGTVFRDADFNNQREGSHATNVCYAAVTARSFHPGGVNVLLMDGSVRFVSDGIALATWRALGTRVGGEVVGDF